jgi:hypothetical protein
MSSDVAELAHFIARTEGIEVLAKNEICSVCDGCGGGNGEGLSICRGSVGGRHEIVYLCNDCITESWARAPSQREPVSAAGRATSSLSAESHSRAVSEEIADYLKSPEGRVHIRSALIGGDGGDD